MTDFYKNFAFYYQELAGKRNHFGLQSQIIQDLFKTLKIDCSKRILDAACGTGAVGNLLYNNGYKNIFLTDGSDSMIDFAKKNIDSNIPINKTHWENLNKYFNSTGTFDSILVFGNSFAHAPLNSHKQILNNIYSGLNENGYFIFDIREWSKDTQGNYIQSGKPDNTMINLGEISINGTTFSVDNFIKYDYQKRMQIVTYIINDINTKKTIETINLEYALFSFEDILSVLRSVGFKLDNIQIKNIASWSYQIICCKK